MHIWLESERWVLFLSNVANWERSKFAISVKHILKIQDFIFLTEQIICLTTEMWNPINHFLFLLASRIIRIFNPGEAIIYEDPVISSFVKSWIVFYRYCLLDEETFMAMKYTNYRPWDDQHLLATTPLGFVQFAVWKSCWFWTLSSEWGGFIVQIYIHFWGS